MTETTAGSLSHRMEPHGGATVVRLSGSLHPATAAGLLEAIQELVPRSNRIALDLAGVAEADSAGLGALVRVLKAARDAGGDLVLVCPQAEVARLLDETGLNQVISVFAGPAEACEHLTKS